MSTEDRFSADEAAQILQTENINVTKRTVNYYAFDKNMFDITTSGKKCFTHLELDKLRAIYLLKEHTSYTLDQIKTIINSQGLEAVKGMCTARASNIHSYSSSSPRDLNLDNNIFNAFFSSSIAETSTVDQPNNTRTIKINNDITLIVSSNINRDKLRKLIILIRNFEKEE